MSRPKLEFHLHFYINRIFSLHSNKSNSDQSLKSPIASPQCPKGPHFDLMMCDLTKTWQQPLYVCVCVCVRARWAEHTTSNPLHNTSTFISLSSWASCPAQMHVSKKILSRVLINITLSLCVAWIKQHRMKAVHHYAYLNIYHECFLGGLCKTFFFFL